MKAGVDTTVVALQFKRVAACIVSVILEREKVACVNINQSEQNLVNADKIKV